MMSTHSSVLCSSYRGTNSAARPHAANAHAAHSMQLRPTYATRAPAVTPCVAASNARVSSTSRENWWYEMLFHCPRGYRVSIIQYPSISRCLNFTTLSPSISTTDSTSAASPHTRESPCSSCCCGLFGAAAPSFPGLGGVATNFTTSASHPLASSVLVKSCPNSPHSRRMLCETFSTSRLERGGETTADSDATSGASPCEGAPDNCRKELLVAEVFRLKDR
mmetsp:Transcript_41732/g.85332  ORF Transcript_41732/g.85332 Transcript_41732/m.85332 type:complete len:221 (-) Transcript_41732:197-859(-)